MIYCIIKNLRREIKTILISINTYAICPFPPDLKPPNEGIIPCKFKTLCGNNFVYQTEEGASVYVAMQFAFTSQVHEQTFKRSVGAGLEHTFNVNGVSIKVGAKIDTAVTKLNRITRDNGSLEVVAYQKGGDVTGLARIFSGENSQTVPAFSCSLNNLKACTSALDKIVQYIASKEFAEGVKTSPAILNYAYRPYWEVDPDVP
ncbi:hypothetical protein, partial [Candidatus Marithrix sp. Canyon 246]|uniref:hypothetical protein n=1 Tax=Candidatus Marithrix sp. Canyon 246 TaxID=1827136 RepID=UPI0014959387